MNTALVIVDVQNDFCAGGSLAVPDADAVIPIINDLAHGFRHFFLTQDWHPPGHVSFASSHPGRLPFGPTPPLTCYYYCDDCTLTTSLLIY